MGPEIEDSAGIVTAFSYRSRKDDDERKERAKEGIDIHLPLRLGSLEVGKKIMCGYQREWG